MPSKVKIISPEQEKELLNAMTNAIKEASAGMDANEAIAKQANEYGLNPEFAARMVEAYNSSKTINHLKNTTGEKRAESFPLASTEKVLQIMYTPEDNTVKAATLKSSELKINFNKLDLYGTKEREKVASELKTEKAAPMPLIRTTIKKAESLLQRIGHAREELEREAKHTKEAALAAVGHVADTFRYHEDNTDFEVLEKYAAFKWGDLGKKAMNMVWSITDLTQLGEKRAEVFERVENAGYGMRQRAVESLINCLQKAGSADAALRSFEKKAQPIEDYTVTKLGQLGIKVAAKRRNQPIINPQGQVAGIKPTPQTATDVDRAMVDLQERTLNLSPEDQQALLLSSTLAADPAQRAAAELLATQPSETSPEAISTMREHSVQPHILNISNIKRYAPEYLEQREALRAAGVGSSGIIPMGAEQALQEKALLTDAYIEKGYDADTAARLADQAVGQNPYYASPEDIAKQEAASAAALPAILQTMHTGQLPFVPSKLPEMISDKPPEIDDIVTPEHEGDIRKIKLQLMANDMIANDPVLSAYPPEDVINAINQIAEDAPALSTSPLLMRNMVARILQQGGHLDPAEIQQLLVTEKAKRQVMPQGY